MARQPKVIVRELDLVEAQHLVTITGTARDRVRFAAGGDFAGFGSGPQRGRGGDVRGVGAFITRER